MNASLTTRQLLWARIKRKLHFVNSQKEKFFLHFYDETGSQDIKVHLAVSETFTGSEEEVFEHLNDFLTKGTQGIVEQLLFPDEDMPSRSVN